MRFLAWVQRGSIRFSQGLFTGTPGGRTHDNADALSSSLHRTVVCSDPGTHCATDMPGRIVPDQYPHAFPRLRQSVTAPGQKLRGNGTDWSTIDEPQPDTLSPLRISGRGDQRPITRQRFGIGVTRHRRLLHQAQGMSRSGPARQRRHREAAPPSLIFESDDPVRATVRHAYQPVTSLFLRAYAGSGLVIQRLARCHLIPNRSRLWRIVSPLTCLSVNPCTKLTSATNSNVQRLVAWPVMSTR